MDENVARPVLPSLAQLPEKISTLLLLILLMSVIIASVITVLEGADWNTLWVAMILGLLVGWSLAIVRIPGWVSFLIIIVSGLSYAVIDAGKLLGKVIVVISGFIKMAIFLLTSSYGTWVDPEGFNQIRIDFQNAVTVIFGRIQIWGMAILENKPIFDPVAANLVWTAIIWMLAAWAGWVAISKKNGLLAIFPIILASMAALSYGQSEPISIYAMLGLSLLIVATIQHLKREQLWDASGTPYPPRKGRQVGINSLFISLVILLVTVFATSISFPRIKDWLFMDRGQPVQEDSGLAKSLGIISKTTANPDLFEDIRQAGLPRESLIGSGPELSRKPVMTVAVDNFESLDRRQYPLYWRSLTFDQYSGNGWRSSQTRSEINSPHQLLGTMESQYHISLRQDVYLVDRESSVLYAAGNPLSVNLASEAAWRTNADLFGILIGGTGTYNVLSQFPVPDEDLLRSRGQEYPEWLRDRYLSLPSDVPTRVKELALQLTAIAPTPYDRVLAIEDHLRTIPYTLDVPYPPHDQDLVDFFLFDLQKGYCDYYASAMVVLSRAAGVPARLVTGYASGEYDLKSGRFLVTEADAHSWVEVYFPSVGWVPFEPTAGRPPINRLSITTTEQVAEQASAAINMIDSRQNLSFPVWWIIIAIIFLVTVLGVVLVGYDEYKMRTYLEPVAAAIIFFRLRRLGTFLGVHHETGNTPLEYANQVATRIKIEQNYEPFPEQLLNVTEEVSALTDRIMLACFKPEEEIQSGLEIFGCWKRLRWQLVLVWSLIKYRSFQERARQILTLILNHKRVTVIERDEPGK